jgi:hypothetical protein
MGVGDAGEESAGLSATGGWSGADGFFACAVVYPYAPANTIKVVTSDASLSAQAGI